MGRDSRHTRARNDDGYYKRVEQEIGHDERKEFKER